MNIVAPSSYSSYSTKSLVGFGVFVGVSILILILLAQLFPNMYIYSQKEGFELAPESVHRKPRLLEEDMYPSTERNGVTTNKYGDIWWYYPILKLGSFAQITNNLRYRKNPDDGKCLTPDFCGALYKNATEMDSNIITPLPPVPPEGGGGVRVNYYTTNQNLFLGEQQDYAF